jgi:catechol 2,3-dioxygenase-like lactoylglutathione lyase family enzyme
MFHATAMVRDYDATIGPLERLFGFRALHVNVSEEEGIGRRGGMAWVGDGSVEIGEPAGANSPVRTFVEGFGSGMHSIALQVDDTEAAKAHFAALGVAIATEPYAGMVWTRPADTAGVLIEWFSLEEPTDPRWGARVPDGPLPLVPVERLAFVTAMVREPTSDGERLAEILGTSLTRIAGNGAVDDIETVLSLGDCSLALIALGDAATTFERWGVAYDRPRVHGIGLLVDDVDAALGVLEGVGIGAHRRTDAFVVLDPLALRLPVMLCDRLLPGDQRSSNAAEG